MDRNGDLKNFKVTVFRQFNLLDEVELTGKENVNWPTFISWDG